MKKRITVNPVADCTKPISPVGIEAKISIIAIGILGPYLSTKGPSAVRIITVPETAAMEEVQICSCDNPKESLTSVSRGEMENHIKNAT